jgi:hypothetical protein
MHFASEKLKLPLPLRFIAGAVNVKDYKMACKVWGGMNGFEGRAVNNEITFEGQITDYGANPRDILRPFFAHIWEECGLERAKE